MPIHVQQLFSRAKTALQGLGNDILTLEYQKYDCTYQSLSWAQNHGERHSGLATALFKFRGDKPDIALYTAQCIVCIMPSARSEVFSLALLPCCERPGHEHRPSFLRQVGRNKFMQLSLSQLCTCFPQQQMLLSCTPQRALVAPLHARPLC